MTRGPHGQTVDQLVERFAEIGVAQSEALDADEHAKFNRLYDQMDMIGNELRSRGTVARLALLGLYDHPNMQVRLIAAKRTLAVAPERARQALEAIENSKCYPQAMDAGMCLINLDRGIFKPT